MNFVNSVEKRNTGANRRSSNSYILESPQLDSVKQFCLESVADYIQKIHSPVSAITPKITQSWLQFNTIGENHPMHRHMNSFISGVLYIKTNPSDNIMFYKEQFEALEIQSNNFNQFNSNSWWIEATETKLVLFPSSLYHSVHTKHESNERISLAFNTFISGTLGVRENLSELEL